MRVLIIVLSAAFLLSSAVPYAEEEVLAEVNSAKITMDDFEKEVSSLPANYRSVIDANKRKFLEDIILQELLYQEAVNKNLEKDEEVTNTLEKLKKKVLAQKLLEKVIMDITKISDDEIKKHYEENKDDYKVPEQLNAAHILVMVKEGENPEKDKEALVKAEGLLKRIKKGDDFSELARENSDCPSKAKGGDLGYFSKGQMVPEFEEAAFKLKPGEVSGIVKTKFGYHIIKLLDKKPEGAREFSEVKEEISQKLAKQGQKDAFDKYTESLKAKAKITINEELLK